MTFLPSSKLSCLYFLFHLSNRLPVTLVDSAPFPVDFRFHFTTRPLVIVKLLQWTPVFVFVNPVECNGQDCKKILAYHYLRILLF